jgi:GNAT superfamily N-acetyltransferase
VSEVREATTEEEVATTYPVMRQLRPHLDANAYAATVRGMRESGYRVAYAVEAGGVKAVAGFRVLKFLAHGRFLYVDDLVTDEAARSGGYGKLLLDWLEGEARERGCTQLQLDSGVWRAEAHRFYFRENMSISSFHFAKTLDPREREE